MNLEQNSLTAKACRVFSPKEFKIVALRECPTPTDMVLCDSPDKAVSYWQNHVVNNAYFNPEVECMVVLLLNTRRKIRGHHLVSIGTLDTILIHPREVFRTACVAVFPVTWL